MAEKQKALEKIVALMERENISLAQIDFFRKEHFSLLAKKWLKSEHKPGWFIMDNGFSSPDPPLNVAHNFGIWLTDTLIVCGKMMIEENTYAKAEEFIYNAKLGPFCFHIPLEGESYTLSCKSSLLSEALKRCGLKGLSEGFYWFNQKVILNGEELVYMNHTKENLPNYDYPDAKHFGIFVINLAV